MNLNLSKCDATGKTRFPTPGQAKEAIIRIKSKTRIFNHRINKRQKHRFGKADQCRYYRCSLCKGYHLTSNPIVITQKTIEKKHEERLKNTQGLVVTPEEVATWKDDGLPFPNNLISNNL